MAHKSFSKSRKVNGWLRAALKYHRLSTKIEPLELKARDTAREMSERWNSLNGGQQSEARRLLNEIMDRGDLG